MKVLLIKTSSLGDVFHTLPAIEDVWQARPDIQIDWVVEEAFADIPTWHPAIRQVIPIAWRRWRKQLWRSSNRAEMAHFWRTLRREQYDVVLDAQGLLKSAMVARMARGERIGLDRDSAREPLASRFYQRRIAIATGQHAIPRLRQLFAEVFDYRLTGDIRYGVDKARWSPPDIDKPYWVFLHGTTWVTKYWPEAYWRTLAERVGELGMQVCLPWGNDEERQRAERIAEGLSAVSVLPKMGLNALNAYLAHAQAVVGVDTGLSHVVAALEVPAVTIYGATDARLTGVKGAQVQVMSSTLGCAPCLSKTCLKPDNGAIQAPCYRDITPERVLADLMARVNSR
ncbi:MAG: lipopolysaccharide heptosyltransferase I [Bacterioplanes sp.]|nr:lipopolysaccharide heptosyltransferase I [Bacterioplanes sp.]